MGSSAHSADPCSARLCYQWKRAQTADSGSAFSHNRARAPFRQRAESGWITAQERVIEAGDPQTSLTAAADLVRHDSALVDTVLERVELRPEAVDATRLMVHSVLLQKGDFERAEALNNAARESSSPQMSRLWEQLHSEREQLQNELEEHQHLAQKHHEIPGPQELTKEGHLISQRPSRAALHDIPSREQFPDKHQDVGRFPDHGF